MAEFYGSVRGKAGDAHRTGTAKSGLDVYAASRGGCVHVILFKRGGQDYARITMEPWRGGGRATTAELYYGPIDPDSTPEE